MNTIIIGYGSERNPKDEMLTITSEEYLYSTNFDGDYNTEVYQLPIELEVWDELIDLLDIDKFMGTILDERTPDWEGGDDFIIVETGSNTHEIRFHYWYNECVIEFNERDEIRDIQPFVEKLIEIRETFRE